MVRTQLIGQVASCDGNAVCEEVLEQTDNLLLARVAGWLAGEGLVIALVVLGAFVASRVLRRQMPRVVTLYINREEEQFEQLDTYELSEETLVDHALKLDRARQRAQTLGEVVGQIMAGTIWFVAALLILDQLGVNLAPLLAGAGVAGIALGFGAQQLVRDFLSGFFIILEDQYGIGDVVTLGEVTGTVERVGLRVTRLRDVDGTLWSVPNGELKAVGNRSQLWSRAVLDIDVSYDTDIDQAGAVLKQVADELWQAEDPACSIIAEPEYWGVERFGADGVTLRLVVRTEPTEQWQTARELRRRVKAAFDEASIEIPFPQRTVWLNQLRSDP